jgi:hypothetical protein
VSPNRTNETLNEKTTTTLKSVAGDSSSPYQIWLRTGQIVIAFSVLSYLGITVTGVEISVDHPQYAPLVTALIGGFCLWYGTNLKKVKDIAEQHHALALRKEHRHPERDKKIKEYIKTLDEEKP